MKVLLVTSLEINKGIGNYLRSFQLFKFFKKKKVEVDFFLYKNLKNVHYNYDIIFLDLPRGKFNLSYLNNFKKKNTKIIALDYTQKFQIDLNISLFRKSNYSKKNLISYKYAVISNEIKKILNKKKNKNFFITLGSSDIKNLSYKIKKKGYSVFKSVYLNKKSIFNIKNNNKIYFRMLSKHYNVACNGGTTLLEMIFLKKNIFAFPQNKDELDFCYYLKKRGFDFDINNYNLIKIKKNLKIKYKNLDSFGISRIFRIIKQTYEKSH